MTELQLIKSTADEENPRNDNSDKKVLFNKDQHIGTADSYKNEWNFIENETVRDNIAYQMQYVEFTVRLYNEYQIYLTVESLLCKQILVVVAGVIESALFDVVENARRRAHILVDDRIDFLRLINEAYDMGVLNRDMKDAFHNLRKLRNKIHISSLTDPEYSAYSVDDVNPYLETLELFRVSQR